jgi:hypothetical protein
MMEKAVSSLSAGCQGFLYLQRPAASLVACSVSALAVPVALVMTRLVRVGNPAKLDVLGMVRPGARAEAQPSGACRSGQCRAVGAARRCAVKRNSFRVAIAECSSRGVVAALLSQAWALVGSSVVVRAPAPPAAAAFGGSAEAGR